MVQDNNRTQLTFTNNNLIDIASGKISGTKNIHKFGYNVTIGVTPQTLWGVGGEKQWITQASPLQILSNNIEDDVNGLGAQQIFLDGLDANWNEQFELVDLIGTTYAYTNKEYIRLNRAYITKVGTYHRSNYDDIDISTSGAGVPMSVINGGVYYGAGNSLYGAGQTENGFYSVPNGKTAYISRIESSLDVGTNKTANIRMFQTLNADNSNSPRRLVWRTDGFNNHFSTLTDSYFRIPEKSDIYFEATSTAPSKVSVDFDIFLVDN